MSSIFTNLNDSNPPAPAGGHNSKWQVGEPYVDSHDRIVRDASCYEPATGGVSVKTGDYELSATDCGKFIILDDPSPATFTLPNPVPFPEWTAVLICLGSGTLSVDASGLLLDGAGGSPLLTLQEGQGIAIQTDGLDYFSFAGKGQTSDSGGSGAHDEPLTSCDGSGSVEFVFVKFATGRQDCVVVRSNP